MSAAQDAATPKKRETFGPAVLVTSAHAGRAQRRVDLLAHLAAAGVTVGDEISIGELYGLKPQGVAWRTAGYRAVIAAGGDGTVGTVATHVAGSDLPLGILPLGTANDVARSLHIPLDLPAAIATLVQGQVVAVDAGQVRPGLSRPRALVVDPVERVEVLPTPGAEEPTPEEGVYFLHAASLGLHAEFARLATDINVRRRWGPLTYAVAVAGSLLRLRVIPVTLCFSGLVGDMTPGEHDLKRCSSEDNMVDDNMVDDNMVVMRRRVWQLSAVNMPVFGGGWKVRAPDIHLQDRLLDIVFVETPRLDDLWNMVYFLLGWPRWRGAAASVSGRLLPRFPLPGLRQYKAHAVVVETPAPVDVSLDGELRAHTPARIQVAPAQVNVIAPWEGVTSPRRRGAGVSTRIPEWHSEREE